MNVKKAIISLASAALMLLIPACEDSGSDSGGGNGYSETAIVTGIGNAPAGSGGIRAFDTADWTIIVTSETSIQKQRPSCSGYDNATAYSINHGDILEFDVRSDHTTYYPGTPTTTPSWIRASRPECVATASSGTGCNCCSGNCNGCGGCQTCGNCSTSCTNNPCSNPCSGCGD